MEGSRQNSFGDGMHEYEKGYEIKRQGAFCISRSPSKGFLQKALLRAVLQNVTAVNPCNFESDGVSNI